MNLAKGIKATVFTPKTSENRKNTVQAIISTYEGNDQDGKARYSSWQAKFTGEAFEKALALEDKAHIVINAAKITNTYDKESGKGYVDVIIFDFDCSDE